MDLTSKAPAKKLSSSAQKLQLIINKYAENSPSAESGDPRNGEDDDEPCLTSAAPEVPLPQSQDIEVASEDDSEGRYPNMIILITYIYIYIYISCSTICAIRADVCVCVREGGACAWGWGCVQMCRM